MKLNQKVVSRIEGERGKRVIFEATSNIIKSFSSNNLEVASRLFS